MNASTTRHYTCVLYKLKFGEAIPMRGVGQIQRQQQQLVEEEAIVVEQLFQSGRGIGEHNPRGKLQHIAL